MQQSPSNPAHKYCPVCCLQVGNANFNWVFQQLVDLHYAWATPNDTMAQSPSQLPINGVLRTMGSNVSISNDAAAVQNSLQAYVTALNASIGQGSIPTSLAGQNRTDSNNSTLVNGNSTFTCTPVNSSDSNASPPSSGFFSSIRNAVSDVGSAISNTFSQVKCTAKDFLTGASGDLSAAKALVFRGDAKSTGQGSNSSQYEVRHCSLYTLYTTCCTKQLKKNTI